MAEKTFKTPSGAEVTESGLLVSGPPTFTQENLSATPTFELPEVTATTPPQEMQAAIGSSANSLNEIIKSLQSQTLPEQNQSFFRKQILSDLEKLSGKTTRTLELEQARGIPEQTKQLQELSNELNMLNAEAQAAQLKAEDMGETTGFVRGEQAQIERQRAVKALTISAQAQAIQGNIALAQSQIDRAVTLEFEPAEQRLKYLQEAYKFNQEDLTRTDKKRSEALGLLINERQRVLDNQKTERSEILKIALKAAEKGASNIVLQGIQGAKTQEEAIKIANESGALKDKILESGEKVAGQIGGMDVSSVTLNAFSGFAPQTASERSDLQTELRNLGLNSETPPDWFKQQAEKQLGQSLTPKRLKELWDEERLPILDMLKNKDSLDFDKL
jgi:hypothetical protein